ncbi:hypothetical protein AVEN_232715-1 [Araneus ventricosus]|uniref:Uncharacterized protein n=1 Tax=Araneus ventricosus TaxID=182803 RepID=A0A4Y2KMR7_ARAVE|nr:hypothetical protein AVEN_232715-1 [Araneus ventricosus]
MEFLFYIFGRIPLWTTSFEYRLRLHVCEKYLVSLKLRAHCFIGTSKIILLLVQIILSNFYKYRCEGTLISDAARPSYRSYPVLPHFPLLADDGIVASVIDDQDPRNDKKKHSDDERIGKGPSIEEAFHCLEKAMKWSEQQEEYDAIQLLSLEPE